MSTRDDTPADDVPYLRIVRGAPTAAELAALVVALRSHAGREQQPAATPSAWGDPARRLRSWGRPAHPGGRSARL